MKYALIIGNDLYDDPKLAQLKTPAADSQALARILGDASIGSFDEVLPLINQSETKVRRAISQFLAGKKPDDLVLLYFSGHGVLDDRGRLYLALKDTLVSLLKATSIPSSFIADEMDSCRSKRQILVLDCCHSGAFARGTKGEQKAITENTFEGSGFGRVVLTASDSTQYALEGDQVIKQSDLSLFTHFLLEGLKTGEADMNHDGQVSLDEWYDYTYTRIIAETPRQVPHKWSYHQQGDLVIARNPFLKKKVPELPHELVQALESSFVGIRESAVTELGKYLHSHELEMVELARAALKRMVSDDSRRISSLAEKLLDEQGETSAGPVEATPVGLQWEAATPGATGPQILHTAPAGRGVAGGLSPGAASWLKWTGTFLLAALGFYLLYYPSIQYDAPTYFFSTFSFVVTGLAGLAQWWFFRPRLESWWAPVQAAAGFVLGYLQKYLHENVSGWHEVHIGLLVAAWVTGSLVLGLILIRNAQTERREPIIPEIGARHNVFLLLLSISLLLAALSILMLVGEIYEFQRILLFLYAITGSLAGVSFFIVRDIPRNFGFISLAISLVLEAFILVQLALEQEPSRIYQMTAALPALASGLFFLVHRETWGNFSYLLLAGYLLIVGVVGVLDYSYGWEFTAPSLMIAALFAVPSAVFFLIRRK